MNKITTYILLSAIITIISASPGDLISTEMMDYKTISQLQDELDATFGTLAPEAQFPVYLYKIVYETENFEGGNEIVSGVIAYPHDIDLAFPMLSFQHGTVVENDGVASNYGFDILSVWLASSGYTLVIADYLGFGESEGLHPYHVKIPTANAVIDMVRASRHFCNNSTEIQLNEQLALAGYSEGGYATLATQMVMELEYPEEFEIDVSFPMAGAYDLSGVMTELMLSGEPYGQPYYFPYILLSYLEAYNIGEPSEFLLPEYADLLPQLFNGNYSGGYINNQLPSIVLDIMIPEVIEEFQTDPNHPLFEALSENDLWDWSPQTLTYLFHGEGDELVPVENSQIAYNSFIENGSENVYFESLPANLGGHGDVAVYCLLGAYDVGEDIKMFNFRGDVNADEIINILDIVLIVNSILGPQILTSYSIWASDINIDNEVDILDIVNIVNLIMNP